MPRRSSATSAPRASPTRRRACSITSAGSSPRAARGGGDDRAPSPRRAASPTNGPAPSREGVMEGLLLVLPKRPQPLWLRYGVSTVIVGVLFLLRLGLEERAGTYGFFLLLPGVFLAAVLFDRSTGFYATALSVLLVALALAPPLPEAADRHLVALALYTLVAAGIAVSSEALRKALERAVAAERSKAVLLQEMSHRMRNNLTILASLLRLQGRAQADPGVREAFRTAEARVRAVAETHRHLDGSLAGEVNLGEYLAELVDRLGETLRGVRPIAVRLDADPVQLPGEQAAQIGLIVNELITNAFKYAFPDDRGGSVAASFRREGGGYRLVVADDGVGCPQDAREGLGLRITRLLVQQLGGTLQRDAPGAAGCRVTVVIPAR
ncbi:MAG: histidine kinase [Bradyrhizobiaceae bacterium]|nr:MAG: histidine kinase [Bradyrhizobiaceae bacterium]